MGIFDKLFKPNPHKLRDRQNVDMAKNFIENKEWDKLEKTGKAAVKPLISCIRKNDDLEILIPAVRALGKTRDAKAIETIRLCLRKEIPLEPVEFDWNYYNSIMAVIHLMIRKATIIQKIGSYNGEWHNEKLIFPYMPWTQILL